MADAPDAPPPELELGPVDDSIFALYWHKRGLDRTPKQRFHIELILGKHDELPEPEWRELLFRVYGSPTWTPADRAHVERYISNGGVPGAEGRRIEASTYEDAAARQDVFVRQRGVPGGR